MNNRRCKSERFRTSIEAVEDTTSDRVGNEARVVQTAQNICANQRTVYEKPSAQGVHCIASQLNEFMNLKANDCLQNAKKAKCVALKTLKCLRRTQSSDVRLMNTSTAQQPTPKRLLGNATCSAAREVACQLSSIVH